MIRKCDDPTGYPWGINPKEGVEYFEVSACCGACSDAGKDLLGHFACDGHADSLLDQGWIEYARTLDSSGWWALMSSPSCQDQKED